MDSAVDHDNPRRTGSLALATVSLSETAQLTFKSETIDSPSVDTKSMTGT